MEMKKIGFFTWLLAMVLVACQSGSNADVKDVTDEDIARTVVASHIAEIEVEGMSCEMGCGSEIRKALRNTGGVAKVDFDFQADREVNTAKVQFDAETIDIREMKRVIESLNKGQFSVGSIDTKVLNSVESNVESSSTKDASSGVQMKNRMISLSEILGTVAGWFL